MSRGRGSMRVWPVLGLMETRIRESVRLGVSWPAPPLPRIRMLVRLLVFASDEVGSQKLVAWVWSWGSVNWEKNGCQT